jgi:hypothetical protein
MLVLIQRLMYYMYYRDKGQVTDQSCHDQTGNILVSPSARKIKEVVNNIELQARE